MDEPRATRPVTLRESSWSLLDQAAELDSLTADEILDSVLQGMLRTDGGRAVASHHALNELRKLFGGNCG